MFVTVHGKESITAKAQKIGLVAGEAGVDTGYGQPSLSGKTFAFKDQIRAAGARWNGADKVWSFQSWSELDAFLNSLAGVQS